LARAITSSSKAICATGQYERNVQVEGATVGTATIKTCEIRARSVRKLVRKKKAVKPTTAAA